MTTTGVGIVGASPGPASWAANAHVPALRAVPEFELRGVATSRRASADAAAELYGVPGHDDYRSLIGRPEVNLVVVAVKVPRHHEIVSAALAAGKMVYCEWPLAPDLGQVRDLAARATAAMCEPWSAFRAAMLPEVQTARELVDPAPWAESIRRRWSGPESPGVRVPIGTTPTSTTRPTARRLSPRPPCTPSTHSPTSWARSATSRPPAQSPSMTYGWSRTAHPSR